MRNSRRTFWRVPDVRMFRVGVGTALAILSLLSSCTNLRLEYPLRSEDADWTTDGRSAHRDRVSIDPPVQLPLEQAWIYNAGGGFAEGSPLIVDNTVVVGTRKGDVHVIGLVEGDQIGTQEFGRSIEGTPAIVDQLIFVPNSWGRHVLSAFDLRSGSYRWRYDGVPIEASVLPMGDIIVAGDVEGNVLGLDRETGSVEWLYEFGDFASVLSAPSASGEANVAIADETGRIAVLEADSGVEIWMRDLGLPVEAGLSSRDRIILVPTTRGRFLALDAQSGDTIWEYRSEAPDVRFTSAAVTRDCVIFGGTDGILRSVWIENGEVNWTFHTDGTIVGAPVVNADIVFVGAMDQKIYAIHRENGSVQWETPLRGRVKSAPAVRNGYLIVLSEPRYVYAFTNAANIHE